MFCVPMLLLACSASSFVVTLVTLPFEGGGGGGGCDLPYFWISSKIASLLTEEETSQLMSFSTLM